jgi:hypothetical protein
MTFDDYKRKVQPGRRVYIKTQGGQKVYGTACRLLSSLGEELAIRFDHEMMPRVVTKDNVYLVEMEESN